MEENLHYSGNLACLCISEGWDLYDIALLSYCGQLHDFWHVLRSCHYSTSLSSSWQPWNKQLCIQGHICCSAFSCRTRDPPISSVVICGLLIMIFSCISVLPTTTGKAARCSNVHCWVGYWHSTTVCDSDITSQWILCEYLSKVEFSAARLYHICKFLHHSSLIWDWSLHSLLDCCGVEDLSFFLGNQ